MRERKPIYRIQRTEIVIKKTHELSLRYPRIPEFIKAIDWALSRRPHHFTHISSDYYLWVTAELSSDEFPDVKILYKIDEESNIVIILDIDEN
jgi:hypothetical protein